MPHSPRNGSSAASATSPRPPRSSTGCSHAYASSGRARRRPRCTDRPGPAARGGGLTPVDQVDRRADDRVGVDAEVRGRGRRRRPTGRSRRRRGRRSARSGSPTRKLSVCGWPSSTVTIGARAVGREELVEDRVVAVGRGPARACSARKTRSAEVRQTTSAGIPAAASSSAAASTSGMIAPMPDERRPAGRLAAARSR